MTDIANNSVDASRLQSFVDRLMSLETARRDRADDIKELMAECKSDGFDPQAIKAIVKDMLADDAKKRKARERGEMLDVYCAALQYEMAV